MAGTNSIFPKQEKADVEQQNGNGKFVREVRSELKKVVWPTKKELVNYTIAVFVAVILISVIIGIVDTVFAELFKLLKSAVR